MTVHIEPDRDLSLQGHYAGIATRFAAFLIDVLVASTLFSLGGLVIQFVVSALLGRDVSLSDAPVVSYIVVPLWLLIYFTYPIAVGGRTPGMALVGLEVVTKHGYAVDAWHALLRTIFLPLSVAFVGIGALIILVNRDRRALHDLVAGTVVVYSWDARAARLRLLARRGSTETSSGGESDGSS